VRQVTFFEFSESCFEVLAQLFLSEIPRHSEQHPAVDGEVVVDIAQQVPGVDFINLFQP
jgi:hypothetical protein